MPQNEVLWMMILALVFALASIVLAYMSQRHAVLAAYAALIAGWCSGYAPVPAGQLWFWLGATVIVEGLNFLLPKEVSASRVGQPYFATGALAGMALGMMTDTVSGVIVGAAAGVFFGALAYTRLADGQRLDFPSRRFFNFLCAKGLPLVVIFAMLGYLGMFLIPGA